MFNQGQLWYASVLEFTDDSECRESVVWRKYASLPAEVHELACRPEDHRRSKYRGFITAIVAQVREIVTASGHRFKVTHEPVEGIQHAEISMYPLDTLKPSMKSELKKLLWERFGALDSHSCK